MDPNNLVLDISSDEDGDWNDHSKGLSDDGDDCNWFAELFGDGSDEVMVVNETEKPVKKSKLNSCLVDLDDDCVVLDGDPNAPVDVQSDNPGNGDDDSEDVLVVSEKGQVACRDYPHSRHLCIKFPFSSTPNQTHCNQCYCYVCDSLAPCVYWGNGTAATDHCHATDKDEFWVLERKNAKNGYKVDQPLIQSYPFDLQIQLPPPPPPKLPPPPPSPPRQLLLPVPPQIQIPNPVPIHAPQMSTNFQLPDFTRHKSNLLASRLKLHQYLTTQPAVNAQPAVDAQPAANSQKKRYNLNSRVQRPVFKRTGTGSVGSVRVATTANQKLYTSFRGNLGNLHSPQVNGMLSKANKSLQPNSILTSSTVSHLQQPQLSNQYNSSFKLNANYEPLFQTTPYQLPPKPPNLLPSLSFMSQPSSGQSRPSFGVPAQPRYSVSSKTAHGVDNLVVPDVREIFSRGNQASGLTGPTTGRTADTGFKDYGLGWSAGQDLITPESTNSSSLTAGGLDDNRYDWLFDDQPIEPGFTDYSSDSAFIDTGPIFDF